MQTSFEAFRHDELPEHVVGPHGNLAGIDPQDVADYCDKHGYFWFSEGWPYSSGIHFKLPDEEWAKLRVKLSKPQSFPRL